MRLEIAMLKFQWAQNGDFLPKIPQASNFTTKGETQRAKDFDGLARGTAQRQVPCIVFNASEVVRALFLW